MLAGIVIILINCVQVSENRADLNLMLRFERNSWQHLAESRCSEHGNVNVHIMVHDRVAETGGLGSSIDGELLFWCCQMLTGCNKYEARLDVSK